MINFPTQASDFCCWTFPMSYHDPKIAEATYHAAKLCARREPLPASSHQWLGKTAHLNFLIASRAASQMACGCGAANWARALFPEPPPSLVTGTIVQVDLSFLTQMSYDLDKVYKVNKHFLMFIKVLASL